MNYEKDHSKDANKKGEQNELEVLRKMDEEARKEKAKVNQDLSKLLSLIEAHNDTLDDMERKINKEFSDIKSNIKKIDQYHKEQDKIKNENLEYKKIIDAHRRAQAERVNDEVENKPSVHERHYISEDHYSNNTRNVDAANMHVARAEYRGTTPSQSSYSHNNSANKNEADDHFKKSSIDERMNNRIHELYPTSNLYAENHYEDDSAQHRDSQEMGAITIMEKNDMNNKLGAGSSQISKDKSLKAPRDTIIQNKNNRNKQSTITPEIFKSGPTQEPLSSTIKPTDRMSGHNEEAKAPVVKSESPSKYAKKPNKKEEDDLEQFENYKGRNLPPKQKLSQNLVNVIEDEKNTDESNDDAQNKLSDVSSDEADVENNDQIVSLFSLANIPLGKYATIRRKT